MGKPLLTDEIIERASRGESLDGLYQDDVEMRESEAISTSELLRTSPQLPFYATKKKKPMIKSRRIENAKRQAFQAKINRILLIVLLLFALLLLATFYI